MANRYRHWSRQFALTVALATSIGGYAAEPLAGAINDVVTPRVVAVTLQTGALKPGDELDVQRDGKIVGRLKVKTVSGICEVLDGELRQGDIVVAAMSTGNPATPPTAMVDPATTTPPGTTTAAPVDPRLRPLLTAQGSLALARFRYARLQERLRGSLADQDTQAREMGDRLYLAARILRTTSLDDRVAEALRDYGFPDLANSIVPSRTDTAAALAPVLPTDAGVPLAADNFGECRLLDCEPLDWVTPAYWGRTPTPPAFSGWQFTRDMVTLDTTAEALLRNDFVLDDAEVSGEVKLVSGSFLYLILRRDIVVKFELPDEGEQEGSLSLKYGYNNIRLADQRANTPGLRRGEWKAFRIRLQGTHLQVWVGDAQVLDTVIAGGNQTLAATGGFGLGGYRSVGAFRSLRVQALTDAGRRAVPLFSSRVNYVTTGPVVDLLAGKPEDFAALTHYQVEKWKDGQHVVADRQLTINGAPFSQFTRKDIAADHFRVTGRLRFESKGSVWLRANRYLLFGLKASPDKEPNAEGLLIKHSTGDFRFGDETFPGAQLTPNRWYTFALEFHDPVGTFSLDDVPVMLGIGRKANGADEKETPGPNQFGVSAYGAKVSLTDLKFQRMVADGRTADSDAIRRLFRSGLDDAKAAEASLATLKDPSAAIASAVLAGTRPAQLATSDEIRQVAEMFKENGNWPTYLAVLEANYRRLPADDPARAAAEKVWNLERQKFDIALETVSPGELGLDNVIHLGESVDGMETEIGGSTTWVTDHDGVLHRYDAATHRVSLHLKPGFAVGHFVARGDSLIAADRDGRVLHRLTLPGDAKAGAEVKPATDATVKLTVGKVIDMVAHPRLPLTYVAVNENARPNEVHFEKYRVYVLDETTMTLTPTDAVAMSLAVDPAGRYVYGGFTLRLQMGLDFSPGPINPQPVGATMDHLITYQIDGSHLTPLNDRPAPGVNGIDLLVDPRGRSMLYLASSGFAVDSDRQKTGAKVPAFRATDVRHALGVYDTGPNVQAAAYHPIRAELYIAVQNEVRVFQTDTFKLLSTIRPTLTGDDARIVGLAITPDGRDLLIARSGAAAGVEVHRLTVPPAAPATAAVATATADGSDGNTTIPLDLTGDPDTLLKSALAEPDAALRLTRLEQLADAFRFTEPGELAAHAWLDALKSPLAATTAPPFPATPVAPPTADLDTAPTPATLTLPASLTDPAEIAVANDREDPKYGTTDDFSEALDELESFTVPSRNRPWSWLFLCQRLLTTYPDSPNLRLRAARVCLTNDQPAAAAALANLVLASTPPASWHATAAWLVLADVAARDNNAAQRVAALSQALRNQPGNAILHRDYGAALLATQQPKRALYHRLVALRLLPSQPALVAELRASGALPDDDHPPVLEIGDLFKQVSPSVVLVKQRAGSGTGWFITRDGLLFTNYHVIGDDPAPTIVIDVGKTEHTLTARVIATDSRRDMALLQVTLGDIVIDPLTIDDAVPTTGDRVVVVGNPGMGAEVLTKTVTEGIVSNTERRIGGQQYIQTSAAVNPGNSGGPMFNRQGRVIGMVTLKASLDNVGFAVPATVLFDFIEKSLH